MFDLKKIDIGLSVDWNDNSTSLSFHHEKKKPKKIKVLTLIENKTCDEEPQESFLSINLNGKYIL